MGGELGRAARDEDVQAHAVQGGGGAEVLSVLGVDGSRAVELPGPPCDGVPRLMRDGALNAALGDPLGRARAGAGAGVRTGSGFGIRTTRMRRSFSGCTGRGAGCGSLGAGREIQGRPASSAMAHRPTAWIATERKRRGGSAACRLRIGAHPHDQLGGSGGGHLREAGVGGCADD